jgi:hypothetical protein
MAIKHSKYRNTAILFELLVRQTTADLLQNKDSKAVKILKKYFNGTELGKEYSLYSQLNTTDKLSEVKADMLITTIIEERKKLNQSELNKLKYNLIKEIKSNYTIDNFFKAKIDNYKVYASIYNIFEYQNSKEVNAKDIIANKMNLLEHICLDVSGNKPDPENLVEEFMKEDKEVRLLAYKIMVEKFNNKYDNLTNEQKNVLKEYINNISETENLKRYLNNKLLSIKTELTKINEGIADKVTNIKLSETIKLITPIKKNGFVKDDHISSVLQYMELIDELKKSTNE